MKFISKYIDYDSAKEIEFQNLNWLKIAKHVKTKSITDCKNKWF